MAANIQPGVREKANSPVEGKKATLLIGVQEDMEQAVIERIEEVGGDVEDNLHYNTLAVSIYEDDLEDLCSTEGITSIELEGAWEPMDEGNFRYPPDLSR